MLLIRTFLVLALLALAFSAFAQPAISNVNMAVRFVAAHTSLMQQYAKQLEDNVHELEQLLDEVRFACASQSTQPVHAANWQATAVLALHLAHESHASATLPGHNVDVPLTPAQLQNRIARRAWSELEQNGDLTEYVEAAANVQVSQRLLAVYGRQLSRRQAASTPC